MEFLAICSIICVFIGLVFFNIFKKRREKGVNKKTLDAFVAYNGLIVTGTTLAVVSLVWFFMK